MASTPTVGTLDLQISDPVSMLNEIARRYESTERILMEYVDNALDDAEMLYRNNNNSYPYPIHIKVTIDFVNQAVTVQDNCQGMTKDILERIIKNVGESQKRGLTWVNGRFGFGVQAFRAAADVIHFQTKNKDTPHYALELQRDQHTGIQGAKPIDDPFPSNTGTGTLVQVRIFDDEWFENITVASIKQEIESHFERLLARPNLVITVSEVGEEPLTCEAFRYRDIPGQDIQHLLNVQIKDKNYPIDVHLKIADFEVPGRIVRFFARGRRINNVAEIKSFLRKSSYRTSVWGHPHLLGYIEVGEIVRPVITRDDFVRNKNRKILYAAILSLEDEIKNSLDRINETQRDTTLNRLEDVLRNVLEKIARQDRRQLRLHIASQRKAKQTQSAVDTPAQSVDQTAVAEAGLGAIDIENSPVDTSSTEATTSQTFQNNVDWPAPTTPTSEETVTTASPAMSEATPQTGEPSAESNGHQPVDVRPLPPTPGPDDEVKFSYKQETPSDTSHDAPQPKPRRRSSFDIQFIEIPADVEGQVKRSYLVDATIYINVVHPDFQERMAYTRLGQPKVTDRLGAYIAATVSIHYKDQFYAKYGTIPDRRDLLFDEQVDFIFRLESALREYLPELEKEL